MDAYDKDKDGRLSLREYLGTQISASVSLCTFLKLFAQIIYAR